MSYENHYKDREPLDTIKIIKDFFYREGYITTEENLESESSTWSCHINLYKNNHFILSSNGKGVDYNFSLASGYAELYERFCNGCHFINNPFVSNLVLDQLKNKNGYYLHPNEKIITFNESINSPYLKQFFTYLENNNGEIETYFSTIYNNFIGVPYKEINNNNIKYFDPRILQKYDATGGMATGNTLLEALNQGISELYEHHVLNNFFESNFTNYYSLNLNSIKNKTLQNIIKKIQLNGNKLFLLDLSYNFCMPVFCGIIINKYSQTFYCNFGAFPIADIAIERVLTELYQNIYSFNNAKVGFISPFEQKNANEIVFNGGGRISGVNTFPDHIFTKIKSIDKPNAKYFLSNNNSSNKMIFDYYKKLAKQLHINFYYIDKSLCENMKCVHIFPEGLSTTLSNFFVNYKFIPNKYKILKILKERYTLIKQFLKTPNEDITIEIINNTCHLDSYIKDKITASYLAILYGGDWLSIYNNKTIGCCQTDSIILNLLNSPIEEIYTENFIYNNLFDSAYYSHFKKQLTCNLYNQNLVYKKLFDLDIPVIDNNPFSLIFEIIFKNFYNDYTNLNLTYL